MRPLLLAAAIVGASVVGARSEAKADDAEEVRALTDLVSGFEPVPLPAEGEIRLTTDQSLTIDQLRGVTLDAAPPLIGEPAEPYPESMADGFAEGDAPYLAEGIEPFRFRYFNCEFNYGGWHNWPMTDYAAAHGFNIIYPYNHSPEEWTHMPDGTQWLRWGGFINWHEWLPERGIADGRYDMLGDVDIESILGYEGTFEHQPGCDHLMIDMEHGRLSPEKLREQDWYPAGARDAGRAAFEKRYYDGYARTYAAPVNAARNAGWTNISVYGWQPFGRTWFGIEDVTLDPETDWAWNAFGKAIYDAIDILNPSVYCFYWSPQNVAYTLANIDLNMRLVHSRPTQKPVRPYYWTLLHGGGGGWRWWKGQPQRDEDMRAMIAMCFFSGCDGFDCWNWSGTGSHHVPQIEADADLMVDPAFEVAPEGGGDAARFERYDVLHVLSASEDGVVRFQRIEKDEPNANYGVAEDRPVYAIDRQELAPNLRPQSAPVAAMIEGMALVKPLEYLLKHGEVRIDISAQKQFAETLPIVRRVKCGRYHVVITYDPGWEEADGARDIVLRAFDGRDDLDLVLPADAQTRVWVLSE